MFNPKTYCEAIRQMKPANQQVHKIYHDTQYGFPIDDDNELFCRLILEINQAGLSWTTILNKQEGFRKAYHNFNIRKVAAYKEQDFQRLMNDSGIIRNRLKINAAIKNARTIIALQREFGSFKSWMNGHHPMSREAWTMLFKKTFAFTGEEIVNEFMVSTGYLPGAHAKDCPVYKKVLQTKPHWNEK